MTLSFTVEARNRLVRAQYRLRRILGLQPEGPEDLVPEDSPITDPVEVSRGLKTQLLLPGESSCAPWFSVESACSQPSNGGTNDGRAMEDWKPETASKTSSPILRG